VLRAAQGQEPGARESLQHRDHLLADTQGGRFDKVVVFSRWATAMSAAVPTADGFPWVFNFPDELTGARALGGHPLQQSGQQEGGLEKLKDKKNRPHLSTTAPTARRANPTLDELLEEVPVFRLLTLLRGPTNPGRSGAEGDVAPGAGRLNPDWIFMSGWGVMNQVAVKEGHVGRLQDGTT